MDMESMYRMLGDQEPCTALIDFMEAKEKQEGIDYIQTYCNCDEDTAKMLFEKFYEEFYAPVFEPKLSQAEIIRNNQIAQDLLNKPKCPICNSTNLTKITATKKIAKMAAFGIFGMGDNGKTWKCKNCGSKF